MASAAVETPSTAQEPVVPATGGSQVADPAEGNTKNASLYVGDLDKDVSETHLFELFSEYGPVHSIRVCRDTVTRRSLGYAYVNFNVSVDPEAAKNAKAKLNYHVVNGKAIRIMWANKNARNLADKTGNIFIKNLETSITTRELHDTFADFGEILACKVATDKDGKSKGYGFVHFSEPSAAKEAIEQVNGAQLGDSEQVVTVTEFISKQDRGDPKKRFTNVYVKNLPASVTTEGDLRTLFSEFGDISSVALSKVSQPEDSSKFFAFVDFETHEAAVAACTALHEKEIEGCKLYVDRAQTKTERQGILQRRFEQKCTNMAQSADGKNIYIKNLPSSVDEEGLKAAFAACGEISSVKVMRDPESKKSRGFGFICFTESSSAQRAVSQMGNTELDGKQLYVAFAQPKAVRAQQLQAAISVNANGKPGVTGKGAGMRHMPGGPGMPYSFNGMGFPMVPVAGRGLVPGVIPHINQGGRGQSIPNGNASNGFNPMMNPMMHMMHMGGGPGMMPGVWGRGGRSGGRGGGRSGHAARGGMRWTGRGMGARGPNDRVAPHMAAPQFQARGGHGLSEESLAGRLANMPDEDRKQQLGEMLFPRLKGMLFSRYKSNDTAEKLASKVTGMMLEMPPSTVLYLLETEDECRVKLEEALTVLRDHGALPEDLPQD